MPLDSRIVQTVRSHGAAIDRRAYELADRFLHRFFVSCPHARGRSGGQHLRQRREVARGWAWAVRRLGMADQMSGMLGELGERLHGRGVGVADMRVARTCLLEALRETSDECEIEWTANIESAWAVVIDECLGLMGMSMAAPSHYAQAA